MPLAVPSHKTGAAGADTLSSQPLLLHSIADLQKVALDIKNTPSAVIADLKTDLREVASRLEHEKSVAPTHGVVIQQVQCVHAQHLIDMNCHLEDLNRGQRCNLQIREIPESVEGPQLQPVVWAIFNTLLDRPPDTTYLLKVCNYPIGND